MSRLLLYYRPGHPKADAHGFVDARDLHEQETALAIDAPIMVDRFYENTGIPVFEDGKVKVVDVGSRKRHREFLRQRGLTTSDDFDKPGGEWERAAKEREARQRGEFQDRKERRDEVGRITYEVEKRGQRR